MATYEIRENTQYNSNEVFFDSKPAAEVLTALRGLKMRWNPRRGCWYGFATQDAIRAAIGSSDNELGGTISDGYMGAYRWDGNKSRLHLYGSDLSKAIREELKRQGIKGVSVSCKTYSGGQSVRVKVAASTADYISREEYTASYRINDADHWLTTEDGQRISRDTWYTLDGDEQRRTLASHARREYDYSTTHSIDINYYHIDNYTEYTEAFRAKLHKINAVLDTFHYDDSNGMVDYFDTNFHRNITVVAA